MRSTDPHDNFRHALAEFFGEIRKALRLDDIVATLSRWLSR